MFAQLAKMYSCNLSPQEEIQSSKSPSASLPSLGQPGLHETLCFKQANRRNVFTKINGIPEGETFFTCTFTQDFKTSFMKCVFQRFDPGFRVKMQSGCRSKLLLSSAGPVPAPGSVD